MNEMSHPKWFCKHCMAFTDHTNIKTDTKTPELLLLSGDCGTCKKYNLNYFPKLKRNPMFGNGVVDLSNPTKST